MFKWKKYLKQKIILFIILFFAMLLFINFYVFHTYLKIKYIYIYLRIC